jgi:hypothetical protein
MLTVGIARTDLTPYWGVELTGWGYYMNRCWKSVHDSLKATAVVVDDGASQAVVIALDLMVIDEAFAARTRQQISKWIGLPAQSVLLTCSHTHNAPAAGGLLGVGECDPFYEQWASHQAATAAILAWQSREPATLSVNTTRVSDLTYNRTRPGGVVDQTLTIAAFKRDDGSPLAILVNFGAHPTVTTELRPWAVSRDIPGKVCDYLEEHYPEAIAMYLQGACGDVNFDRQFATAQRWTEPAQRIASAAIDAINDAQQCDRPTVAFASDTAVLPTRRWTDLEIASDRDEAIRRLASDDTSGWREGFGKSMTNRPDDMVTRHGGDEAKAVRAMCRFHLQWTELMMVDLHQRPETLMTEVQAVRIGELIIVSNAAEFFSPFAIDVRQRINSPHVMIACYANGRIGYLPDEYDIDIRSYAGYQSPKYCNQFPFTAESGPAMCEAMVGVSEKTLTLGN